MSFPGSILLTQGDEFKETIDKRHPLGTRGYTRDGRVFRYAKAGATALTIGRMMQVEAVDGEVGFDLNPATSTAPTTGSTTITLELATGSSIGANDYADGYLIINDGTGEGQMVVIEGNSANAGSATGNFDVYLREESCFTVAPTTACEMGITKNKYDDIIVSPKDHTGAVVGVTPRAVSANYYFWLATWGPCPVKTFDTVNIGAPVVDSSCTGTDTATAGDVMAAGIDATADILVRYLDRVVGNVLQIGATGETSLIDLTISP